MSDMFPPTRPEVIAELERELHMRNQCYPNWKQRGTIKADVADKRLRLQEAAIRMMHEAERMHALLKRLHAHWAALGRGPDDEHADSLTPEIRDIWRELNAMMQKDAAGGA